ncbi:MAG: type IV pilus secretin PilQ [Gammaproteobacteria bacterium]|nr:type IV pilus secretin PilQ [Gammaproteobacteria bacterium]
MMTTCSCGVTRTPRNRLSLATGFALLAASQLSLAATVEDITYTSLPGDRVLVRIVMDESAPAEPISFTIDNPARIALDFPDTTLDVNRRSQSIGIGNAESVTAVEAGGRTRVVVNLAQLVPYEVRSEGNAVMVTLEGSAASLVTERTSAGPSRSAVTSGGSAIDDIDFRRGPNGEAQIIVALSDPSVGVNINDQGNNIVVDFANTRLPDELDRTLDVLDFATPAQEIDTFSFGNGTRMVIKPTGLYEHLAYQSDDLFTLELRPLTPQEQEQLARDKFGYTGERLSLNFQDIEVRAVLQLIADFTGKNLVASDTVTGNVTLRLRNVPWDQALDIILKSKGLGMRDNGNVIMVAPQEEIAAREKLELEAEQALRELAPLRTEFVQVNYAKASDIAALVKAEANNLLSERGNVSVDERTNTLLLQDTAEKISEIRRLVTTLDIPVRQVLIESRIVIANQDFSKDLGVSFGYSKNNVGLQGNGNADTDFIIGGTRPGRVNYGGGTAFVDPDTENENYIVDLPVSSPAGAIGLAVGRIGSYLLQLELSALQVEGRGEVISAPRVITANQKEAFIESGTEIPYQEATSSGATSVEFKKAVLSLRVTPQITPDDRIIMDLAVNRDAVGQVFATVPSIDTNELQTQVLVDNGETVVLGGIYESTDRDDLTRVPFFSDIPYLGTLFRRSEVERNKQELLVFVTPKILKDTLTLN